MNYLQVHYIKMYPTTFGTVEVATIQALAPTTQKLDDLTTAHAQLNTNQQQLNSEFKYLTNIIKTIADKMDIPLDKINKEEEKDRTPPNDPSTHRGNNNNINGRPFNDDMGAEN